MSGGRVTCIFGKETESDKQCVCLCLLLRRQVERNLVVVVHVRNVLEVMQNRHELSPPASLIASHYTYTAALVVAAVLILLTLLMGFLQSLYNDGDTGESVWQAHSPLLFFPT